MKATSVRARSSKRVAAAALVVLSAVTVLAGCGFETRQQGAAVVNGEVIHEDQVEETARQLQEAKFNFPENIVVTALVASPLLHEALSQSGGWQPDATDTTKEFINTVALLQSGQMTAQDVARYRESLDKAKISVNPRFGELVRSEQPPVFFTIGQQRPNWILAPGGE